MNASHRLRLRREKEMLKSNVCPKYILPYLVEHGVMSKEEENLILFEDDPEAQVSKMLELLPRKNSNSFNIFLEALRNDDIYPWLANRLEKDTTRLEGDVYKKLVNGGVPFETNHAIIRDDKLKEIQNSLKKAALNNERRQWVVLYGMPGNGKSVLAADAVRCNKIFETYPKGVYWISIGKLNDESSLMQRMQILLRNMGYKDADCALDKVEKITDFLKQKVANIDGQMLVILDDVHEASVIRAFDIGCPVMVTTIKREICQEYSSFVKPIQCSGLTENEGRELLASYVRCRTNDLPAVVNRIHGRCKGSPMLLSIIGAEMSSHGNVQKRWDRLDESLSSGINSALKKSRHCSDDARASFMNKLKSIVRMYLEQNLDVGEKLKDLSVFPEDVFIPNKVFEIFWGIDAISVEDIMHELYDDSFIFLQTFTTESFAYSIHDLYLEILRDEVEDLPVRHKRLVDAYLQKCRTENGEYDFSLIDDNYMYYYIGHHLYQGSGCTLFQELFFDLGFIHNKLQCTGPSDLLYDYRQYEACFEDKCTLRSFETFIRRNAGILYWTETSVIQTALFEPKNSVLYQKALKLASKVKNKYFEWCNCDDENQSSFVQITKFNAQEMWHADFSPDGSVVAAVGERSEILLWLASTGEELDVLSGHSDDINYCVFDSKGEHVVSASKDKTVKIFEVDLKQLKSLKSGKGRRGSSPCTPRDVGDGKLYLGDRSKITFRKHNDEVLCCAYSPDDSLVISSDSSGKTMVWFSETQELKHCVPHGRTIHPVNFCCFEASGKFFGTASDDKVCLWNCESGTVYRTFPHDNMTVQNFCVSSDKRQIISISDGVSVWSWSGEKYTLPKMMDPVCCSLSDHGNLLACGTAEPCVAIVNINDQEVITRFKEHNNPVTSISFSRDGRKLISVSSDVQVIYDLKNIPDKSFITTGQCLSVQNNNDLVVAHSSHSNCIEVRCGQNGKLTWETAPEESAITVCSLSYDCSEVVYGTKCGSVKVFYLSSDNPNPSITNLIPHGAEITYLKHKYKDAVFYSCSDDKTLRVWNDKFKPMILRGHTEPVIMCVPFNKSNNLLSCSKDGSLRVWNTNSGKMEMVMRGHGNQSVTFCDISHDDKLLASASADRNVIVWDAENGQHIKILECKHPVRCCRFSPLSTKLISVDDGPAVELWDLTNKFENSWLGSHRLWVRDIIFSGDFEFVTVSDDIKFWEKNSELSHVLVLPGASTIAFWASDDFKILVLIHSSTLYILRRI